MGFGLPWGPGCCTGRWASGCEPPGPLGALCRHPRGRWPQQRGPRWDTSGIRCRGKVGRRVWSQTPASDGRAGVAPESPSAHETPFRSSSRRAVSLRSQWGVICVAVSAQSRQGWRKAGGSQVFQRGDWMDASRHGNCVGWSCRGAPPSVCPSNLQLSCGFSPSLTTCNLVDNRHGDGG